MRMLQVLKYAVDTLNWINNNNYLGAAFKSLEQETAMQQLLKNGTWKLGLLAENLDLGLTCLRQLKKLS